jgi:ATP-dependent DNA ligase
MAVLDNRSTGSILRQSMRGERPMRLLRILQPFDHTDWIFEPKMDGFRALAHIKGRGCTLV